MMITTKSQTGDKFCELIRIDARIHRESMQELMGQLWHGQTVRASAHALGKIEFIRELDEDLSHWERTTIDCFCFQ